MAKSKKRATGNTSPSGLGQASGAEMGASVQQAAPRPPAGAVPKQAIRSTRTVPAAIQQTDIKRELRRIGILTAIILIILVVLSRLLS